jgi:hypothetical protein
MSGVYLINGVDMSSTSIPVGFRRAAVLSTYLPLLALLTIGKTMWEVYTHGRIKGSAPNLAVATASRLAQDVMADCRMTRRSDPDRIPG